MLIDALIEYGLKSAANRKLKDVRAGLGYTCVMLEGDSCGLAYTFRNELGRCCGALSDAGSLIGRKAAEIITWAKSGDRLKAAIGLAVINAIINDQVADWDTGNVTGALDVGTSDTFGMIGEFRPILSAIKNRTENIYVFEQDVPPKSSLYSSDAIPLHLPECSVVLITATSIINHTFEEIIPYCKSAREVCIAGPSTPLCSEAFREYNVTLLAGSIVRDPELALQIISQGGGTKSMKPAITQVLVRVNYSDKEGDGYEHHKRW
jgi:uncharacterized protein (DUF4213/DUF364 family)